MSREEVREVWQKYWAGNQNGELRFDEVSQAIFTELLRNCGDVRGKKILEAGCGRGIISEKLAGLGADVYLLDISPEALKIARKHFDSKNISASFTCGDILDPPFEESPFDIVWNAGVMEHFHGDLQSKATRSLADIVKRGGLFITFNPSAGAFFYTLECRTAGLTVVKEYPICFRENLSFLSYVSKHLRSAVKLLLSPFPQGLLTRIFGGYLLVTAALKEP